MKFFKDKLDSFRKWGTLYKRETTIFAAILILIFATELILNLNKSQKLQNPQNTKTISPVISVKPTNTPFTTYKKPVLARSERYDIYLVGDSMTHAFGPRGGKFNEIISKDNPGIFFEISNYAEANQSILLLPE